MNTTTTAPATSSSNSIKDSQSSSPQLLDLMKEASMHNAYGIYCLNKTDFDGGYRHLKHALVVMTRLNRLYVPQDGEDNEDEDEEDMIMMDPEFHVDLVMSVEEVSVQNDTSYFGCTSPILFSTPARLCQRNIACCVAAAIFNTALAYQQRGGSVWAKKALTLYQQCASIAHVYASPQQEQMCSLQLMAVNNQVQILASLEQREEAQTRMESLDSLLSHFQTMAAMSREEGEEDNDVLISDDILEELILNLLTPATSLMAAAA